jgi:hypothetical protein
MRRWLQAVCLNEVFSHDWVEIITHFLKNGTLTKYLREGFYRMRLRRVRNCLKESKQTSAYRARHRLGHNPHRLHDNGRTSSFPILASGVPVLKQWSNFRQWTIVCIVHPRNSSFVGGPGSVLFHFRVTWYSSLTCEWFIIVGSNLWCSNDKAEVLAFDEPIFAASRPICGWIGDQHEGLAESTLRLIATLTVPHKSTDYNEKWHIFDSHLWLRL